MQATSTTLRRLLYLVLGLLAALRIDLWLWTDPARAFGLPVGLSFHAGYCLAVAACLGLLVRHAWPHQLTVDGDAAKDGR